MTWTLHAGTCEEGLSALEFQSVDHVITDPPYTQAVENGFRSSKTGPRTKVKLGVGVLTAAHTTTWASLFARVVRRWCIIFTDIDDGVALWKAAITATPGLRYVRTGVWVREHGTPQLTGDRPGQGVEAIVIAHRDEKLRWNGKGRSAVWRCPIVSGSARNEPRVHPTQKPVRLMHDLVRDFTDPDDLVCDPFAGSGTTGIAALLACRRFVGWERDAAFAAAAHERLERACPTTTTTTAHPIAVPPAT